jgi:hypothetical protein
MGKVEFKMEGMKGEDGREVGKGGMSPERDVRKTLGKGFHPKDVGILGEIVYPRTSEHRQIWRGDFNYFFIARCT